MEKNVKPNRVTEVEDLIFNKVDVIASHIQNGNLDFAMIELGTINEYAHVLAKLAMANIPNNML